MLIDWINGNVVTSKEVMGHVLQSNIVNATQPVSVSVTRAAFDEQLTVVSVVQFVQSSEVNALVLQSRVANAGSS